jgi:hypothetical protein
MGAGPRYHERVKRSIKVFGILALAAGVSSSSQPPAPAAAAADSGQRVLAAPLAPGTTLEIDNILGSIVARAADGPLATVDASIEPGGAPGVRVVVERRAGRVKVCAVYGPSHGSTCEHQGGYNDHTGARVEYEIAVPPGVNVDARNVAGRVTLRGIRANVDAKTVTGDVTVDASGAVSVGTVSGGIHADLAGARSAACSLRTVNGNIALHLSRAAGVTIAANTLAGEIDAEPPLDLSDKSERLVGRRATARLGDGATPVSLETVNGSIHVGYL